MLDFITERVDSWEMLRQTELPIFIYGMGDGADKILRVFDMYSIPVAGFFASDEFVRGHSFRGHLVHSLSQIEALIDDFIVVLAFGAGYRSLYDRIEDIASRHTLIAPDVPVVGDGLFTYSYCMEHAEELQKVYDLLADDMSRQTFADVINFRISGRIDHLTRCTAEREQIFSELFSFTDDEIYIDMGAYNGDTVTEFAGMTGYRHIYAVEPDTRNFRKLTKNCDAMENITLVNAAAYSEDTELDFDDLSGRNSRIDDGGNKKTRTVKAVRGDSLCDHATLIKMDVEGAESEAIQGCRASLVNGSRLICALYHRTEDIFALPLLIHSINPDLRLYMRHLLYIPAWETNLYCI